MHIVEVGWEDFEDVSQNAIGAWGFFFGGILSYVSCVICVNCEAYERFGVVLFLKMISSLVCLGYCQIVHRQSIG